MLLFTFEINLREYQPTLYAQCVCDHYIKIFTIRRLYQHYLQISPSRTLILAKIQNPQICGKLEMKPNLYYDYSIKSSPWLSTIKFCMCYNPSKNEVFMINS